jgi:hypothetical protein
MNNIKLLIGVKGQWEQYPSRFGFLAPQDRMSVGKSVRIPSAATTIAKAEITIISVFLNYKHPLGIPFAQSFVISVL